PAPQWPSSISVKSKKCRVVQYVDTSQETIRKHGFILRHRTKMDADECEVDNQDREEGELTLKYRTADLKEAVAEKAKPWSDAQDRKFESDLLYSKSADADGQMRRAFSISANVQDESVPSQVGKVRDLLPDALP